MNDYLKLTKDIKYLKQQGKIIGFTNGCFDLLHEGHVHLLSESKKLCDYLVLGMNSDLSIKKIKGNDRPIDNEQKRFNNVKKLQYVDDIIIFNEDTPLKLIQYIIPNILIKGADYKEDDIVGSNLIKKNGGQIILIDLIPNISTTQLIKKFDT